MTTPAHGKWTCVSSGIYDDGSVGIDETSSPAVRLDLRGGPCLQGRLMMGARGLSASIQSPSGGSRGGPDSDGAMLVSMHTGTQSSDLRLYVEDAAAGRFLIEGRPLHTKGPAPGRGGRPSQLPIQDPQSEIG